MDEQKATKELERHIQYLRENWKPHPDYNVIEALRVAIYALEKQKELRENCEGSCLDCKYRGEFHCANDLLIDSEV